MYICTVFVVLLASCNWFVVGIPTSRRDEVQTPAEDRMWEKFSKNKGPTYEINPNFGFRSYHQIRYEPMTVPFTDEYQQPPPAPIPPVDFGFPVPAYNYGGGYGAESTNVYRSAVPYGSGIDNSPMFWSEEQFQQQQQQQGNEFGSRQTAHNPLFF